MAITLNNHETPQGTYTSLITPRPESLWTLRDLRARLNLCDRATRNLVKKGLIPSIRLSGKALRFNPVQVEKALAKLTVGGAA